MCFTLTWSLAPYSHLRVNSHNPTERAQALTLNSKLSQPHITSIGPGAFWILLERPPGQKKRNQKIKQGSMKNWEQCTLQFIWWNVYMCWFHSFIFRGLLILKDLFPLASWSALCLGPHLVVLGADCWLCSGITPSRAWGTISNPGTESRSVISKVSTLISVLFLWHWHLIFCLLFSHQRERAQIFWVAFE